MSHIPVSMTRYSNGDQSGSEALPARVTDITAEARRLAAFQDHEQVLEVRNDGLGLDSIIAIHDTSLGPALGGCRALRYPTREAALTDALRLSRGMTYKAALAGLDLGGGKAVILVNDDTRLDEPLFRCFGRAVESLEGCYITGEDSGTSVREMDWISRETDHVIGTSALGGDPSLITAAGVLAGIRAAIRHRLGRETLNGITVAVQGLGHVGAVLCHLLADAGARLKVADIVPARVDDLVETLGAEPVDLDYIHRVPANVFSPCALGAVLNATTVRQLRCAVVAGSANNQLDCTGDGEALRMRGILYAPDYVINAGGLIAAAMGLAGRRPQGPAVRSRVEMIGATLAEIFRRAKATGSAPEAVADEMALERLQGARAKSGVLEGVGMT